MLYASHSKEVDGLSFGSVGVILGLKHTRTGDTLVSVGGHANRQSPMRDIIPPPAVISTSIVPQSHSDLEPVKEALQALMRTDPSVRVEEQEGQLVVHGLGALHLDIIEGRLRHEWKARFEFGKCRVSYREGLGATQNSPDVATWQVESGGKHISITVDLDITSLEDAGNPIWDGNIVLDGTGKPLPSPKSGTGTPESFIAQGISSILSNSPHTSLPLTRLRIQVKGYTLPHSVSTSFLAGATAAILRDHLRAAGPGPILEPYVLLKISINEGSLGKVVKDLTEHGGEVQNLTIGTGQCDVDVLDSFEKNVYMPPPWLSPSRTNILSKHSMPELKRSLHALAPLSRFLDYSARLRALSGGYGVFEMQNAGFREVTPERRLDILKEIGRA